MLKSCKHRPKTKQLGKMFMKLNVNVKILDKVKTQNTTNKILVEERRNKDTE